VRGFITERHFEIAERTFPGIRDYYRDLNDKPSTFLELVWRYERRDLCEGITAAASGQRQSK
jgi:hypothetical protein